jgi:hypothetical protein
MRRRTGENAETAEKAESAWEQNDENVKPRSKFSSLFSPSQAANTEYCNF